MHWWYGAFSSEIHSQAEKKAFENRKETYSAVLEENIAVKSDYMQYTSFLYKKLFYKKVSIIFT